MEIKVFNNEFGFSSNVYVISDESLVIVIDPGFYDGDLKQYLKNLRHVDIVLLTHGHFDHISGLDNLKADFPDMNVYIHSENHIFLTEPKLNCSVEFGFDLIIKSKVDKINEKVLKFHECEIEVINTPGHTQGSVMFYFINENILFTGDTIMKDTIGATHRPTGNNKDMKESIRKFINLNYDEETLVFPGHDKITTYKDIINNNDYIKYNH